MSEKLATIERIHSIVPHPNADRLDCAKVLAYPVVVKKNEYKENDPVIFIKIDSVVPDIPYFNFLRERKFRVWNAKFKKMPSVGLVCPLNAFPDLNLKSFKDGDDLTAALQIQKFERPIDLSVNGDALGAFPSGKISQTDEYNLLSYPEVLAEFRDKECYLSVKCDGSSMTVINDHDGFRICSRRLELKEGDNAFWRVANKHELRHKLYSLNVAIQSELCGPKIQDNKLGLKDHEMYVFNVKNLDTGAYFGLEEMVRFCESISLLSVPILSKLVFDETWTIDRLQEIANNLKYANGNAAEGIVLRPVQPVYSSVLGRMLSVKIINQNY